MLIMRASGLGLTAIHRASFRSWRPPTWSWCRMVRKSLSVWGISPNIWPGPGTGHGGYRFIRRKQLLPTQFSTKNFELLPKFSAKISATFCAKLETFPANSSIVDLEYWIIIDDEINYVGCIRSTVSKNLIYPIAKNIKYNYYYSTLPLYLTNAIAFLFLFSGYCSTPARKHSTADTVKKEAVKIIFYSYYSFKI